MPIAATRCYHVNVNCSDLDRSLAWYGETLGLTTLVRTRPGEPQPGDAFGLDLVQWDAWILQGAAGHSGVVLGLALDTHGRPVDTERGFTFHLIDSSAPASVGADAARPPAVANELGIFRTALFTSDIDGDHQLLVDAGTICFSPPVDLAMGPGLPPLRALFFAGPDGECVELIEPPRT